MKWQKGVGRKECIIHSPKWQENIWSNIKKLIPLQGEGREKKKKKVPERFSTKCPRRSKRASCLKGCYMS